MATTASPAASVLKRGVAPLRAGQGTSFLLRRLHSLTGIIPVGAFLFEHILISNATAISGPDAYARQVSFLANLPLVFFLELFGIWIPILFHGLYGFYIWYPRGRKYDAVSLDRQLDVHTPALDGRHRFRLHRVAHLHDALHGHRSARCGIAVLCQGASRSSQSPAVPLLRGRFDRSVLALRLRHLVVLGKMGDRDRARRRSKDFFACAWRSFSC